MNKLSKFKIIEESFLFIGKIGWKEFSIERFAEENNYKTSEVKNFISNKNDLLIEFSKMIDEKVESNINIEEFENSNVKDNIFELIMMRFDAMTPFKGGLKKIINEIKSPIILKEISQNILVSMDFYLEFSNAYDDTIFDVIKKKSLFLIYSYCFKVWLNDDSKELSKTMSELDRLLNYAEKFSKKAKDFLSF
tara:strand:+ start:252 stop:830 length:579 start_codon:yes stop_codon:yes gene_type:complete